MINIHIKGTINEQSRYNRFLEIHFGLSSCDREFPDFSTIAKHVENFQYTCIQHVQAHNIHQSKQVRE